MLFKQLKLAGFKSFVEPTVFHVEPGLTGIVGPNGCGKSNLVEALRWVMGETSAKSLRGGAMDDVIFAGTNSRPARNLAEVLLELDNSDRTAPSAFNDSDELVISRRIERESGSVYRINGREVRARDVQLLFADAATGAHSPAMVSQGRVAAVIAAKPQERRSIIEEAAGITGLHSRRHEAELRLRAAEKNLERLDDVTGQIGENLRNLKRQARQARRYRRIAEQIRQLEAILLYQRWRQADQAVAGAAAELERAGETVAKLTAKAAKATTARIKVAEKLPGLREAEAAAAAGLHRLAVERDGLEAEERRVEEAHRQLTERLAQLAHDAGREEALATDAGEAVERLAREQAEIGAANDGHGETLAEAVARAGAEDTALRALEAELDALNAGAAALAARRESLDQVAAEAEARIARTAEQLEEVAKQRAQQPTDSETDAALEESRSAAEAARATLEQAATKVEAAEQARQAGQDAEQSTRETWQVANDRAMRLEAEAEALRGLLSADGEQSWSPLIDGLTVAPGYEAALGAALGDDLLAPEDESVPAHWAAAPNSDDGPDLPDGAEPLGRFVTGCGVLARRLAQIGVVSENDGPALRRLLAQGQRLVSRDGSLWRWDGFTATAEAPAAAAQRLEQRNRLARVDGELTVARAETDGARSALDQARAGAAAAAGAETEARGSWSEHSRELAAVQEKFSELARAAAGRGTERVGLEERAVRLAEAKEEAGRQLGVARQALAGLAPPEQAESGLAAKRREVEQARGALSEARARRDGLEREAALRQARLEAIGKERAAWQERASAAARHQEELAGRIRQGEQEKSVLASRPKEIARLREALIERLGEAEAKRRKAADSLAARENDGTAADKAVRQSQEALAQAREERVRVEAARDQGMERREAITERIAELLDCAPEQVPETAEFDPDREQPDPGQIEVKVERLKRERENIGAVNLRAEMEAQETEEQLETMFGERDDLVSAIARLRQGISNLNREGRERLRTAFTEVNEHFGSLFQDLFGGGKAYLEFTDSDDPLEAGLEIMARPPGKRLQIMSLLSGGEQAMTALALIFAVFLTNPAPICVLDEVDAPLDDANVARLCSLLDDIAGETDTRFLIVTHNAITMAHMNRLFGVTMAEPGVSQLVSVDLEQAEDLAAVG